MRSRFEQYKKLYITGVDILMLFFAGFVFYHIWITKINSLQYINFKNKGNWLVDCFFSKFWSISNRILYHLKPINFAISGMYMYSYYPLYTAHPYDWPGTADTHYHFSLIGNTYH